jgi:hypothetical protein
MGFENLKRLVGVVPTKFRELSSLGVSREDGDEAIREKMWAYLVGLSGEILAFRQYRNVWMDAEIPLLHNGQLYERPGDDEFTDEEGEQDDGDDDDDEEGEGEGEGEGEEAEESDED